MPWRVGRPQDRRPELVGLYVQIWWNDEAGGKYYSGRVQSHDPVNDVFYVLYEDQSLYDEKLDETWQWWDGPATAPPPEAQPSSQLMQQPQYHMAMVPAMQHGIGIVPIQHVAMPAQSVPAPMAAGGGYPIRQQEELELDPDSPQGKLLNPSRATYTDMAIQALENLDEKGASLVAIRKWIVATYPETMKKQKASFNSLTKKAVFRLVAENTVLRTRGTFRLNPEFTYRKSLQVDGGKSQPLGGAIRADALLAGDRKTRFSQDQENIFAHNRELREELAAASQRRDAFLFRHKHFFLPFLPEKHNFFESRKAEARKRYAEIETLRTDEYRRGLLQNAREQEAAMISQLEEERLRNMQAAAQPYTREMAMVLRMEQQQSQVQQYYHQYHHHQQLHQQEHYAPPVQPSYVSVPSQQPPQPQYMPLQQADTDQYDTPGNSTQVASMLLQASRATEPTTKQPPVRAVPGYHNRTLEFYDFPFDGGPELLDCLTQMGFITDADRLSGARLSISGRPIDHGALLPPLELDAQTGELLMDDKALIGTRIPDGLFADHVVVWPGSRIQLEAMPREADKDLISQFIDWRHVYWLREPQANAQPDRRSQLVLAIRFLDGRWASHRYSLIRTTQKYAESKRIPVDNLVHINYRHPITGQWEMAERDYCWGSRFAEAARRSLKNRVEKDLEAFNRLQAFFDQWKPEGEAAQQSQPTTAAYHASSPQPLVQQQQPPPPQQQLQQPPQQQQQLQHHQPQQMYGYGSGEGNGYSGGGVYMTTSAYAPQPSPHYQQQQHQTGGGYMATATYAPPPTPAPYYHHHTGGGAYAAMYAPTPTAPPVSPTIDPAIRERCKWIEKAMRRNKMSTLEDAAIQYEYLLNEGARLGEDLLRPVRHARDRARHYATQIARAVENAAVATPPATRGPEYLARVMGEGEEEGEKGATEGGAAAGAGDGADTAAPQPTKRRSLKPIDPLAGVERLALSRTMTAEPHVHQIDGLSWLVHMYKNHMPAILGDQMGLGKTFQAISFLAYLKDNMNVKGPHLIVAPLSVLSNWMAEFERFCPSMRCVRFHGPKAERNRIKTEELSDVREFDVVVTTYEILVSEANWFRRKFVWRVLIVDEGHRLKNEKSQLSECLRRVHAFYRLLLTGTPTQNNLRELWALFHYLLGDVFPSQTADTFAESFDAGKNVMDMERLRASRALLSLVMLRRRKEHISMRLPSKTELAIMCGLSEVQRSWYKRVLTGIHESLLTQDKSALPEGDWRKLLNLLLQLRKVCNHPYLMTNSEYNVDEELVESSGKLQVLDRMLPRLREDGHRVLLFSQFTTMLDILEDFCMMRGYDYCRLDGSTNRVQRRLDIRRFNAVGSQLFIFLISTRAGGQGINLASADTVILYDSDWNPQVDLQAMERCHRIGQTKPVRVYRLVVRKSVEERMVSRAHRKLFLNEMVAEKQSAEDAAAVEEEEEEEDEEEIGGVGNVGTSDDQLTEEALLNSNNAMAKDEVAKMIRSGVTALFETGKTEVTDEEIDILLGRKEGVVETTLTENDDDKTHKLWQQKDEMQLKDVNVRELEGVTYEKVGDVGRGKKPENQGLDLADLVTGVRKRKQRTIMVDGKGTGYGGDVPVLAEDYVDESAAEGGGGGAAPNPKRIRRDWDHEKSCFICKRNVDPKKVAKMWIRCGWCPHIYHFSCLQSYTGEPVDGTTTVVCPQHKCTTCVRNTASAGGLLFRCVDCPKSFCEDCLEEELCESLGRWKPLEQLNYISKMVYWIRCPDCVRQARGDEEEEEEEEDAAGEGALKGEEEEDEAEEEADDEDDGEGEEDEG